MGFFEVVVSFDNKDKAKFISSFFIQVFLSLAGPINTDISKNTPDFREVQISPAHVLNTHFDFSFEINQRELKEDLLDKTYLKIVVLKSKEDKSVKKKAENWVALKNLGSKPELLTEFKQKKMFSSKAISVFVHAIQH